MEKRPLPLGDAEVARDAETENVFPGGGTPRARPPVLLVSAEGEEDLIANLELAQHGQHVRPDGQPRTERGDIGIERRLIDVPLRSEERRVGKECRSGWAR